GGDHADAVAPDVVVDLGRGGEHQGQAGLHEVEELVGQVVHVALGQQGVEEDADVVLVEGRLQYGRGNRIVYRHARARGGARLDLGQVAPAHLEKVEVEAVALTQAVHGVDELHDIALGVGRPG